MGQYDTWLFYANNHRFYFVIRDTDGQPVSGAAGLDSEYSADGNSFSDCTNEATEIGSTGIYYIDLITTETTGTVIVVRTTTTTTGATTTVTILYPQYVVTYLGGTAQAGAAGSITLSSGAPGIANTYIGCPIKITGGTGAGQVRVITAYISSTKVATVYHNWTTTPDNTSTYAICYPMPGTLVSAYGGAPVLGSDGTPRVDVYEISGDATAADNLESYCDGTDRMPVDVREISEDETAADNLELITEQSRVVYAQNEDGDKVADKTTLDALTDANAILQTALGGVLAAISTPFSPTVVDDFNRSNEGPPMTGWADLGDGMEVISNQCAADVANAISYYNTVLDIAPIVDVSMDIPTLPADGEDITLILLSSDLMSGYLIAVVRDDSSGDTIVATDATSAEICQASIDLATDDSVGVRCVGGSLLLLYHRVSGGSWQLVGGGADSAVALAYAGLGASDTTARLDNFAITVHSGAALADDAITATTLASDVNTYQAKVWLIDDDAGGNDRYVCAWFKNSEPVTSGITSPMIQVIKSSDGTDLVGATAMTQIGALGLYRYDENTNRIASGATYIVKVTATIGGASRTWYQPVGRDA